MTESELQTTCEAMNARGERCAKRAVRGRFCLVHAGEQNMAELGRKGGSRSPLTKLRQAADDELREKAKAALVDALEGDDEKRRFEAAKSLYSFRAAAPPTQTAAVERSGGKPIALTDLLEAAAESRILSQLGLDPDAERDLLEKLRARNRAGEVEAAAQAATPTPL
jgi:hypothetical protein